MADAAHLVDVQEDDGRMAASWDEGMPERLVKVEVAVREVQGDVRVLQGDVHVLQEDVRELKGDVREIKGDVRELRGEIASVESRLRTLIEDTRDDMKKMSEGLGGVLERIEHRMESMCEYWRTAHADHEVALRDHAARIVALEQRPGPS